MLLGSLHAFLCQAESELIHHLPAFLELALLPVGGIQAVLILHQVTVAVYGAYCLRGQLLGAFSEGHSDYTTPISYLWPLAHRLFQRGTAFFLQRFGSLVSEVQGVQHKSNYLPPVQILGQLARQVLYALPLVLDLLFNVTQILNNTESPSYLL